MKIKNHNRNKNNKSLPKSSSREKSKQKSKQKSKKFNPVQYLNALIQLTNNTNVLKNKQKKVNQKRDLSSALTIATPGMQQTISSSKIRCKSSYSQYRKKCTSNNLKQILNVNLNNYIITEEEDASNCIKFTSISSVQNSKQSTPVGKKEISFVPINGVKSSLSNYSISTDFNYYATQIQRAWRSYQTYKMVRKYYKQFKKQRKIERQIRQNKQKSQYAPRSHFPQSFNKHTQKQQDLNSFQFYIDSHESYEQKFKRQSSQNQDSFSKTIKIKVNNKKDENKHNQLDKQQRFKRQGTESSNELNLTQKLNELKQFIQSQRQIVSQNKIQAPIQEIPTIQMKKGRIFPKNKSKQRLLKLNEKQICRQQKDDSSTQKKRKPILLRLSPDQPQISQYPQNRNRENLDHSITSREKLSIEVKNVNLNPNDQQKPRLKKSKESLLVDSMIQQETQKYNEILKLIQSSKSQNRQKNTPFILNELLTRLEKHKKQLQMNRQDSIKKSKYQEQKVHINDASVSQIQSNESFLAFDSRDIYRSFEQQNFDNASKNIQSQKKAVKNELVQCKLEITEQKLKQQAQQRIQTLRRYYEVLNNQSKKIQNILSLTQNENIELKVDLTSSLDQSSILVGEKNNGSEKRQDFSSSQGFIQNEDSRSISSFYSQTFSEDSAKKMLKQHIKLIESRRNKSISNLQRLVLENRVPKEHYAEKLEQIFQRYRIQSRLIEEKKEKYLKSLRSVKKQALEFQKDLLSDFKKGSKVLLRSDGQQSGKGLGLRRSFSADSIVLRCILKQPIMKVREISVDECCMDEGGVRKQDIKKIEDNMNLSEQKTYQRQQSYLKREGDILSREEREQDQYQGVRTSKVSDWTGQKQNILIQQVNHGFEQRQPDFSIQEREENERNHRLNEQKNVEGELRQMKVEQAEPLLIFSEQNQFQQTVSERLLPTQPQSLQKNIDSSEIIIRSDRLSSNINDSCQRQISSQMIQHCSEQLQKIIQTQLINEFLEQIYLNDHLLIVFRPFIEELFEFTPITDSNIIEFITKQLPKSYPNSDQLLQRANQKINPTSIEILRLVRDFQFQIDQYQLILSEEVFRKTRKQIESQYLKQIESRKNQPIKPNTDLINPHLIQKINHRERQKRTKIAKYLQYQRDMKIMYMKAIFNCLNQFLIEQKSIATHVNTRTSIGPGELSLSIKEFNTLFTKEQVQELFDKSHQRIKKLIKNKCMLPVFKNYKQVSTFQQQMLKMIKTQFQQTEYKWVTYMDEVLQIWNQMANYIVQDLIKQFVMETNNF